MTSTEAYTALLAHLKQTEALGQVAQLISWDQEAMMPRKGADARSEQAGAMQAVLHTRRTSPAVAEWLAAIDIGALDDAGKANVRLAKRSYDRATRIPADLDEELARTTSRAQGIWASARSEKSFADFAPTLSRVLDLTRQRASCLKAGSETLYDALLDDYEPGARAEDIADTFSRLRTGLTDLRARIAEQGDTAPRLSGSFPADKQLALASQMATAMGYDDEAGRIDLVVHPFCSGTRGDVRITTRVDPTDPFNCLYSTIHETGHALYEQGLDPALAFQPAGGSVSMGVHESQSRFYENQIGRSAAYADWLFPRMTAHLGEIGLNSANDLYRAVNRVESSYIRTEADEVHYNLHIMLRFELERAMISGDLEVGDLEDAWNTRFQADFGLPVPDPSLGVLQDVHWSVGLFGYFPTYALGNLYAGCLTETLRTDIPDMDDLIHRGEFSPMIDWMRRKIHSQGSLYAPRDLITQATGSPPTEVPLLAYLNAKFGELYAL